MASGNNMQVGDQEFLNLMKMFEKNLTLMYARGRTDKEKDKELWKKSQVYQNGEINELFKAYRLGYVLGKAMALQGEFD